MERSLALTSGPHLFPCGDSLATLRAVWETHARRFEHHYPGEEFDRLWAVRVFERGEDPDAIEAEERAEVERLHEPVPEFFN
jgi:hypothetical protein